MTPYQRKQFLADYVARSGQTWSTLHREPRRRAMLAKRDIEYHNAASHDDASAFRRRQQERARTHGNGVPR